MGMPTQVIDDSESKLLEELRLLRIAVEGIYELMKNSVPVVVPTGQASHLDVPHFISAEGNNPDKLPRRKPVLRTLTDLQRVLEEKSLKAANLEHEAPKESEVK